MADPKPERPRRTSLSDAIKALKETQGSTIDQAKESAAEAAGRSRGGRPRKEIDVEQVWVLAAIQCTNEEIAAVVKCSVDTLERRGFAELIEKARAEGKSSLRREMWFKALSKGNTTMQIWLSKQHLGMKDKTEVDSLNAPPPLPSDDEAADQLADRLDRMAERMGEQADTLRS